MAGGPDDARPRDAGRRSAGERAERQFLEIEPGLGKLVGLISLQALPRRITLDFRDVFSEGFQFDRISSSAQIDSGVLKLKEFRMRGSAAEVEMTGEIDLAHETQDLRVRVLPSLTDSAALGIGIVNPVGRRRRGHRAEDPAIPSTRSCVRLPGDGNAGAIRRSSRSCRRRCRSTRC